MLHMLRLLCARTPLRRPAALRLLCKYAEENAPRFSRLQLLQAAWALGKLGCEQSAAAAAVQAAFRAPRRGAVGGAGAVVAGQQAVAAAGAPFAPAPPE